MSNAARPQLPRPFAAGLLLTTACILAHTPAARATGFHDETADGAEIMMKELRWPFWAKGTYFCMWYSQFHHNKYTTFYGGVATAGADKPPGMFMTYWSDLTNVHEGPCFYRHGHGAEGACGGANGKALFMQPGGWYRFVMRTFADPASDESTLVGWWVKDVDSNVWHTHSVVKIPAKASAVSLADQLVVSWAIPPSAAPQLRYAVEAFAAAEPDAPPIASRTETAPHVLAARLDTKQPAESVRLTVTDIFDNVASMVVPVKSVTAAGADSVADAKPGLAYQYYEAPGGQQWERLPDFTQLKPARLGYVRKPDDTVVQGRQNLYGLRYDGWIHAPRTGLYVFELGTCDGGKSYRLV